MSTSASVPPGIAERRRRPFAIADLRLAANPWAMDIDPTVARDVLRQVVDEARSYPDFAEVTAFKACVSMLHRDVLVMMRWLAAATSGAVLEIGPYIGGSTVMLAHGVAPSRPLVVVEAGGASPAHPHIPSDDILADLEITLSLCGVRDRVQLVKSWSFEAGARDAIQAHLGGRGVSLLSIDADGRVAQDFEMCRPFCAPGCIVIIDDYVESDSDRYRKADSIKPWVQDQVARGALIEFGVYGWGTWIGRLPA
jgi:predicted O-methyltransferase YrrM